MWIKFAQYGPKEKKKIMIKIGQTHVFLKDYVRTHQIGSHFVGGYQLDFSPTEPESKTFILQAFSTR